MSIIPVNKSSAAYPGLSQEFATRCRNLCRHTLPAEIWEAWQHLEMRTPSDKLSFPSDGGEDEKLDFIDRYLFDLLSPKDLAPPNRNVLPNWRADLNKYRGWLLHRCLLQLDQIRRNPKTRHAYVLPEDLSKIVGDLYLFHKHIVGVDANISNYSFDQLKKKVDGHRLQQPIEFGERVRAHAAFLITDTSSELEAFLPEGWKATTATVITAEGGLIRRSPGAKLIALLEDGTEVIQLLTEKASRAYGSPDWCTAFRRRATYFSDYKDDLLLVLAPNGERWQLHARKDMYMDATDTKVDLGDLFKRFVGLEEAFLPYLLKNNRAELIDEYTQELRASRVDNTELFERFKNAFFESIDRLGSGTIEAGLKRCLAYEDWEEAMAPYLGPLINKAIEGDKELAVVTILNFVCTRSDMWANALKDYIHISFNYLARDSASEDILENSTRYSLLSNFMQGDFPEWESQINDAIRGRIVQRLQQPLLLDL